MVELENLTDRTKRVAKSIKNAKKHQLEEMRRLHEAEKALNRSTAKQLENIRETTKVLDQVHGLSQKKKKGSRQMSPALNLIDLRNEEEEGAEGEEESEKEEEGEEEETSEN